jgi:hypothetical protein
MTLADIAPHPIPTKQNENCLHEFKKCGDVCKSSSSSKIEKRGEKKQKFGRMQI